MTCVPDAGLIAFSSGPGELPNSKIIIRFFCFNTTYYFYIACSTKKESIHITQLLRVVLHLSYTSDGITYQTI